jgi:aldehyde dehydrogenase (NAD+)
MITCWKLAPAIATGNTLIIKTPELAPLYGQKLASLVREAGFPPGVINILCGLGQEAGQALAEHMGIRKIAFTGSGPVGRRILRASADSNLKKVTLELGGKGASIIFGDADVDNAVFWAVLGVTANNGQVCAAGSRIYVHASVYDRFLAAFGERIAAAAHGDPLSPGTAKGPVVSGVQKEKILGYVERARQAGIRLLAGGEALSEKGHFVANTAFADVPEDAQIMQEEIFGPVAVSDLRFICEKVSGADTFQSIAKFEDESDVVRRANASVYGLAAAIFTRDVDRAQRVSAALESGQVNVNCWGTLNANTPFGGVKQSGFGRDMGEEALDSWLSTKVVKYRSSL